MLEIDPQWLDDYRTHGVVLIPQVIAKADINCLLCAAERALREPRKYFHYRNLWTHDSAFAAFSQRSAAPRLAAQLLASDRVNLLFDQLFVKTPGSDAATGWHNDQPYWPVRGPDLITIWIALDDIDKRNGAMEFIRASHLWEKRFAPFVADGSGGFDHTIASTEADVAPLPDFEALRSQLEIVQFPMRAGDALAFNGMIVHSARGNRSSRPRRAYAIRYVGRHTEYWPHSASVEFLLDAALKPGDSLQSSRFPQVYPDR